MFPESRATPRGRLSWAAVAGPPSPSGTGLPATVVIMRATGPGGGVGMGVGVGVGVGTDTKQAVASKTAVSANAITRPLAFIFSLLLRYSSSMFPTSAYPDSHPLSCRVPEEAFPARPCPGPPRRRRKSLACGHGPGPPSALTHHGQIHGPGTALFPRQQHR